MPSLSKVPVRRLPDRGVRLQGSHRPTAQTLSHAVDRLGADGIAALRCQQASRPGDRIWPTCHDQMIPRLTSHSG